MWPSQQQQGQPPYGFPPQQTYASGYAQPPQMGAQPQIPGVAGYSVGAPPQQPPYNPHYAMSGAHPGAPPSGQQQIYYAAPPQQQQQQQQPGMVPQGQHAPMYPSVHPSSMPPSYGPPGSAMPHYYGQQVPPPGASTPPGLPPSSGYPQPPHMAYGYPSQPAVTGMPVSHTSAPPSSYPGGFMAAGVASGGYYASQMPGIPPGSAPPPGIYASMSSVPMVASDPTTDARVLKEAMKGLGTDEKTLISILGTRTPEQVAAINTAFATMFGKPLSRAIDEETSGDFGKALKGLLMSPAEFDASEMRKAMAGIGCNTDTLAEILSSRSNGEIQAMKTAYERMFKRDLVKDVESETSSFFRKFCYSLLQAAREENDAHLIPSKSAQIEADVGALYSAGEGKFGTDETGFISRMCPRSVHYNQALSAAYTRRHGKPLEKAIEKEFSGSLENGLIYLCKSREEIFATALHHSMKGLGTDEDALTRNLIAASHRHFVPQVAATYQRLFGRPLSAAIHSETSGDYRKALLALAAQQ